jgi:hypothetical protein
MTADKLKTALLSVDWQKNVDSFLADAAAVQSISTVNYRLALWSKQFETVDASNPALCFIREMQSAGHQVATLLALSLYKSSAASMRAMAENALYYTYFRTHFAELATIVRDPKFFIQKADVINFHKAHTVDFSKTQEKLGLLSRLDQWYSRISSVIHGQVPGKWHDHKSIAAIKPISATLQQAIESFVEGEEIVHRLFLCTVGRELWDTFSSPVKGKLLAGLPGDAKVVLGLAAS